MHVTVHEYLCAPCSSRMYGIFWAFGANSFMNVASLCKKDFVMVNFSNSRFEKCPWSLQQKWDRN